MAVFDEVLRNVRKKTCAVWNVTKAFITNKFNCIAHKGFSKSVLYNNKQLMIPNSTSITEDFIVIVLLNCLSYKYLL